MTTDPTHQAAQRRRILFIVALGGVFAVLALAFFMGSNPPPPTAFVEIETNLGHVTDQPKTTDPDDWQNLPGDVPLALPVPADVLAKNQSLSSVVTGDNPQVSPEVPLLAQVNPKQAPSETAQEKENHPLPSTSSAPVEPSAGTSPIPQGTVDAEKATSSKGPSATGQPQVTKPAPTASEKQLRLVKPIKPQPGIIARTGSLVTEHQYAHQDEKNSGSAGQDSPQSHSNAPAKVEKKHAQEYAQATTDKLRKNGSLKPSQSLRLPRKTEALNPKIWREDDTPSSTTERRPFGLVVEERTANGIPLRTDIAPGASALEKTGADKPLWKRPGK